MRQCKVFVHDVEAGILQETDDRQYIFTYQDGYMGDPVCSDSDCTGHVRSLRQEQ